MPVRIEKPKIRVRDVWKPRQVGEYATPTEALEQVKEWYWRDDEKRGTEPPSYEVIERRTAGQEQVLTLQHLRDEFCVQVRFHGSEDSPRDIETRPVSPEEAYRIALDRDERFVAHGWTLVNERHPRKGQE
jgi:hypothetical protein